MQKRLCRGIYNGSFGAALDFAGHAMLNTGQKLLSWSLASDFCLTSVADFVLARSNNLLPPYYGMDVGRVKEQTNGFLFCPIDCDMGVVTYSFWKKESNVMLMLIGRSKGRSTSPRCTNLMLSEKILKLTLSICQTIQQKKRLRLWNHCKNKIIESIGYWLDKSSKSR